MVHGVGRRDAPFMVARRARSPSPAPVKKKARHDSPRVTGQDVSHSGPASACLSFPGAPHPCLCCHLQGPARCPCPWNTQVLAFPDRAGHEAQVAWGARDPPASASL